MEMNTEINTELKTELLNCQERIGPKMLNNEELDFIRSLMLAKETLGPETWWWFSFSSPSGWLGGAYIKCRGVASGLEIATCLGINPGGEVKAVPIAVSNEEFESNHPPWTWHRLLSKADLEATGGALKMPDDMGSCACQECNRRVKRSRRS